MTLNTPDSFLPSASSLDSIRSLTSSFPPVAVPWGERNHLVIALGRLVDSIDEEKNTAMRFARIVYVIAAVYGFLTLIPLYFMLDRVGQEAPPAVSHPEFYYGFLGVTL